MKLHLIALQQPLGEIIAERLDSIQITLEDMHKQKILLIHKTNIIIPVARLLDIELQGFLDLFI